MKWLIVLLAIFFIVGSVTAGDLQSNSTSFTYNITPQMGTQTSYQMRFILSNVSGVAGYYAPDNIIYTNGSTRPDWMDINATDGSSNPLSFWIENGTQTAYNATAWVNAPTIDVGNISTGKWYFGNASQTTSTMNGLNTFPLFFDDCNSINTTQVTVTGTTAAGGICIVATDSVSNAISTVSSSFPANTTFRSRYQFYSGVNDKTTHGYYTATKYAKFDWAVINAGAWSYINKDTSGVSQTYTDSDVYKVREIKRNGTASLIFSVAGLADFVRTTQVPTGNMGAHFTYNTAGVGNPINIDWFLIRKSVITEPTTSVYSSTMPGGGVTIVPSFTVNTTIANAPVAVQFTDTSTGSPIQWNWSFDDGTYSTVQNPVHTFSAHAIYNVSLVASTASSNATSANTTLYFQRSAVTIGDSIARGLGFGRVYNIYTGVGWNESYRPSNDATAYESEMQFNHTPLTAWDWRYNMGWGGDTTTGVKTRWLRDGIGQGVYLADTIPNYTLDNKTPSVILLDVGINDITSSVPAATIKNNIWYCVNDANTRGIPIIVISIFPKATNTAAIQAINTWESAMFNGNASMPSVRWVDAYTFLDDGSGNIKVPYNNGDNVHISPTGYIDLTSKIYTENSDLFDANVIVADFIQTPNPSTVNQTVTLMDTSTDGPTTWNWTIDGSVTNTTQNAAYAFSTAGTHTIDLNVTNSTGSFSNITKMQTVVNVSGFTQQDLWQTPHFTITLNIKDSSNAPIPVVTVTDSNGQSYTTANGTAYFTEDAGAVVFYFAATGYTSKAMSYVVDEDATHTVQLATAPAAASQNTWWTPHTVQITLMDASYGFRLTDVAINATYNESAMPTEWVTQLYGIQSSPGADMVNKSLRLGGTTGSDGTLTTTMLGSLKYDIYLTSSAYGLNNYHVQAYPSDVMLNIYVATTGTILPTNKNSTYTGLNGTRVYITEPDIHNVSMCIDYIDTTGNTNYVNDTWMFQNNNTVFYTSNFTPGVALNTSCYTLPNVRGTAVWWGWNASRIVA
jgi:PKD repeat protein